MSSGIVDPTLVISSTIVGSVFASFCLGFIVSQYALYRRSILRDTVIIRVFVHLSVLLCIAVCTLVLLVRPFHPPIVQAKAKAVSLATLSNIQYDRPTSAFLFERGNRLLFSLLRRSLGLAVVLRYTNLPSQLSLLMIEGCAHAGSQLLGKPLWAAAALSSGVLASVAGFIGLFYSATRRQIDVSRVEAFLYTLSGVSDLAQITEN